MNSIVLTKAQMDELESLGFDISDANLYHFNEGFNDSISREVSFRTYTITDLIKKLPRYIQPFLDYEVCIANGNNEDKWKLRIEPTIKDKWWVRYVMNEYVPKDNGYCEEEYHHDDTFNSEFGDTLLVAVFKMLKWLKNEETKKKKKYLNL